MLYHITVMVK